MSLLTNHLMITERLGCPQLRESIVLTPAPAATHSARRASKSSIRRGDTSLLTPHSTFSSPAPSLAHTGGSGALCGVSRPQTHSHRTPSLTAGQAPRLAKRGRTAGLPVALRSTPSPSYITVRELYRLVNAVNFSASAGTPINNLLTVAWKDQPNFRDLTWHGLERRFLQGMSHWLRRNGVEPTYTYFRENVAGRGPHNHVLLHLPAMQAHDLRLNLSRFLLNSFRFNAPGAVNIKSAPGPIGLVKYAAKALDPTETFLHGDGIISLVEFLGIKPEKQAAVPIQRVGCTHNLGWKQRSEAGFVDIGDILALQRAFAPKGK